eukprot:Nitzschia sp. Nitz4//scaffold14_size191712//106012//106542//NITZ4_001728-RA/size191712-processed-gene-0.316-mRNA-1//-1//CDS//3329536942//2831//frame0
MCGDARGTASCCCVYSVVGTLFMLMVVMMLTYQPLIMGGIESVEQAKTNAYGALATFVLAFLVSVVYLVMDSISGGGSGGRNRDTSVAISNSDFASSGMQPMSMEGGGSRSGFRDFARNLDLPSSVQEGVFS